jgi:hypothetical protein
MPEVESRLRELQSRRDLSVYPHLDDAERGALYWLHRAGIENLASTIHYTGPEKWVIWAAETIVWTVRRLRAGENREALRGFGQLKEYRGHNGGFLPAGLSDYVTVIQNELEGRLT